VSARRPLRAATTSASPRGPRDACALRVVRRAPSPTLAEDGAGAATRSASGRADRADDDARRAGETTRAGRAASATEASDDMTSGRRRGGASRARAERVRSATRRGRPRRARECASKTRPRTLATTRDVSRRRASRRTQPGIDRLSPPDAGATSAPRVGAFRARARALFRRNTYNPTKYIPPAYVYHTSPPRRSDGSPPLSPPSPSPARPRARRSRAWPDHSPPRRSPTSSPRPPPRA